MTDDKTGGMSTEEKPGRETLELVNPLFTPVLTIPVGMDVTVGNAEIKLLKALVSTAAPVEICEMREEISEARGPVAVAATEVRTPGTEGLEVPAGAAIAEEIKPEGSEVAVGSSEMIELNAPVLTLLAVES